MQRSFIISLSQEYYSEKVCLSQYDSDYAVNFEVLDKGAKAPINGMTAYFEGTRCDGLSFRYSGTASDNYVSFTIDTALTAVAGRHTGEIILYDGSGLRFGSANVQIFVEKAARPDNAIDADVEEARTIAEQVQEIVDTAAERVEATYSELVDRVTTLEQGGSGLTSEVKAALLACFRGVAWRGDVDSDALYSALDTALNPPANLSSISAVYTQSGTVDINDSLESLRTDLVVTAHYSDSTSGIVTGYTLSGTLTEGTSTITVSYGGKTTTFTVVVTAAEELWIDGLATGSTASFTYAPFILPTETYDYNYSKQITAIEGNFSNTGVISVGYYTGGHTDGTVLDDSNIHIAEALTVDATGQKKLTLANPLSIPSGSALLIGAGTDTAVFAYGGSLTNGFVYKDYQNKFKAQSKKLGMNVYRR